MSQERTEAVVLRGVDFSESSRIVTLLSPERGRLVCMAKGVKRPKSPLAGMVDTFNRLEVVYYWKDGRAVQQLGDTTLLDGFPELKRNLEKSSYGTLALEIALKISRDNEPSEALYHALLGGLESLKAWAGDTRSHACWQIWRLLAAGGFEPGLDTCCACGKPAGPAPGFTYAGGVTCRKCASHVKLTAATYQAFRGLGASPSECPAHEAPLETFRLLVRFTSHQLESDLRSVRVIEKILGR